MDVTDLDFLVALDPDKRAFALAKMRPVRARRGQPVLGKGAGSTDVYFVLEGRLGAVLYAASGREVVVRTLGEGAIFGELPAIDGLPRSASVVAETDARLVALSRENFLACVGSSADGALWLARVLAGKVREMTDRVFELSALNVRMRVRCELLRLARQANVEWPAGRLEPAPSHAEIASRIGTHREAVTREIRSLVDERIIRQRRRSLEFVDLGQLEAGIVAAGAT